MELAKYGKWSVRKGADGVIYCNCPGWRFNRKCKHLADYHSTITAVQSSKSIVDSINSIVEQQANELRWNNG